MSNDSTKKMGFFDKLFASGREALSLKNIIGRLFIIFGFGFLLGVDLFIKNVNESGLLKGIYHSYREGFVRGMGAFWDVLSTVVNNIGSDSPVAIGGGTWIIFALITIGLFASLFHVVRTVLDIFDFEQGEALSAITVLALTFIVILIGGFISSNVSDFNIIEGNNMIDTVNDVDDVVADLNVSVGDNVSDSGDPLVAVIDLLG